MQGAKEMAQEVRQILDILTERLALPTRWNGTLRLDPTIRERGSKPFGCEIVLRYAFMQAKALRLQGTERAAMVRQLSEANVVLTRRFSF